MRFGDAVQGPRQVEVVIHAQQMFQQTGSCLIMRIGKCSRQRLLRPVSSRNGRYVGRQLVVHLQQLRGRWTRQVHMREQEVSGISLLHATAIKKQGTLYQHLNLDILAAKSRAPFSSACN